jgi:signal transduction histidine kinase/CheY-like chemotaxis protein
MSNNNFISLLTLRYKDKGLESAYLAKQNLTRRTLNIIMSAVILLISLGNTLYIFLGYKTPSSDASAVRSWMLFLSISSSVFTGIFFILLLMSIFIRNHKVQAWISITGFFFLVLVFTVFKFILASIKAETAIYALMYSLTHFYRLTWFYFGLISHFDNIFLTLAVCAVNPIFLAKYAALKNYYGYSIDNLILIVASVIAYFYMLEKKKSFYYNYKLNKINQWYQNLVDNANNGFVKLVNDKIDILNKVMVKNIMTNKDIIDLYLVDDSTGHDPRTEDTYIEVIKNNSEVILNELFKNLTFKEEEYNSFAKYDTFKRYLKDHIEKKDEFGFVGTTFFKSTIEEGKILHFEIFGRYYLDTDENGSLLENYELMFNDVTNAITTEEAKAEVKYKAIFLSKVAHEFKNPLLCIIEFINQFQERIKGHELDASILELVEHIKSMSSFLIILIKDMDYFSTKGLNMSNRNALDIEKVNLDQLIDFCRNIVHTLLKKYHKEDNVKFAVEKINAPRYILSDDMKLKQIIINLLSNSVKFTMSGVISLSLESFTDYIKFTISDTGTGLTNETKDALFKPYSKAKVENNSFGSGLGLSIVKELIEALGSKIQYDSTLGQGTIFSFTLQLHNSKEKLNRSRRSSTYSAQTTPREYQPVINYNIVQSYTTNIYINENRVNTEVTALNIKEQPRDTKIILVVDDEIFTRKSTVRLLKDYINKKHLNIEIQEAADGIESLYLYYLSHKQGKELNLIISDQSMALMNGTTCFEILSVIIKSRGYKQIPLVLLTAYDTSTFSTKPPHINEVVTKPITLNYVEKIINLIE